MIRDLIEARHGLGLTQAEFWNWLGVTQSGGSRYESGRNMPLPVKKLAFLLYLSDFSRQTQRTVAQAASLIEE